MTMGHRIAVMRDGKLQQVGTPLEVYDKPANVFVAQFIGTPPMNFFDATISNGTLRTNAFSIRAPKNLRDGNVRAGIRPENIRESQASARGLAATVRGVVEIVEPVGHEAVVHTRVGDDVLVSTFDVHSTPKRGDTVDLLLEIDAMHLFDAATEKRL